MIQHDRCATSSVLAFATLLMTTPAGCSSQQAAPQQSRPEQSGRADFASINRAKPTLADRKVARTIIHWQDGCERGFDYPDQAFGGLAFFIVAPGKSLVQVTCTLGAYQGYQNYFLLDETQSPPAASELSFETYEDSGDPKEPLHRVTTKDVWGTPTFDEAAKALTVLNRFRAIGDCGTLTVYRFNANRAQLVEARVHSTCDNTSRDPKAWQKINRE